MLSSRHAAEIRELEPPSQRPRVGGPQAMLGRRRCKLLPKAAPRSVLRLVGAAAAADAAASSRPGSLALRCDGADVLLLSSRRAARIATAADALPPRRHSCHPPQPRSRESLLQLLPTSCSNPHPLTPTPLHPQINVRVTTMDAELEFALHPNTTGKQLFDQVR